MIPQKFGDSCLSAIFFKQCYSSMGTKCDFLLQNIRHNLICQKPFNEDLLCHLHDKRGGHRGMEIILCKSNGGMKIFSVVSLATIFNIVFDTYFCMNLAKSSKASDFLIEPPQMRRKSMDDSAFLKNSRPPSVNIYSKALKFFSQGLTI